MDKHYETSDDVFVDREEYIDWMKEGESGQSNFELTIVSYDDHKVALRFDRCPVFDSVKHLEDREIAYLSSAGQGNLKRN